MCCWALASISPWHTHTHTPLHTPAQLSVSETTPNECECELSSTRFQYQMRIVCTNKSRGVLGFTYAISPAPTPPTPWSTRQRAGEMQIFSKFQGRFICRLRLAQPGQSEPCRKTKHTPPPPSPAPSAGLALAIASSLSFANHCDKLNSCYFVCAEIKFMSKHVDVN